MCRLILSATELEVIECALRCTAYEDRRRAERLEARFGGWDNAEMRNLIETYRQDAEDEIRLADTIFERVEMPETKEDAE
jgi:hypothetical protein|nr:MAG TPA: hypothetical protein [Caudoviricetes sp.]DAZ76808.1 MAG TPA: hypothetical protein [Caudoviricetes sp.]